MKLGLVGRVAGCTGLPDGRWANVLGLCWMLRDGLCVLKTPSHVSLPAPAFRVLVLCGGVKTDWVVGNEIRVGESDERDKFGNVLRWLPGYVGSLLSIPS